MPISNAEAQRRFRARQKEKKREALRQPDRFISSVGSPPFYLWLAGQDSVLDFQLPLDLAGIPAPEFRNNLGPEHYVLNGATDGVDDPFGDALNSLGRAEVMVGCLIDAAAALADLVNRYKQEEISSRIARVEELDLTDPIVRKRALAESVRLNRMLERIDKKVRWTFPEWKVADE